MFVSITTIIPDIWLLVAAVALLMLGVCYKGVNFSVMILGAFIALVIAVILQIIWFPKTQELAFHGMFITKSGIAVTKIVCMSAAAFCLWMSGAYFRLSATLARFELPVLIILAVLGMNLMLSANHLISFYVSIELQSLALYVLAAFYRDNLRSTEAGLKYFALGALSSGLLLYGSSLLYGFTGSASFTAISQYMAMQQELPVGVVVALVFMLCGMVFKISAVPFHMWTPDVYQGAPTPVTAFFTTAPKLASLTLLLRLIIELFPAIQESWKQIFWIVSVGSMMVGAFAGLRQQNIKRLLAYSSIGHIGYALISLVVGGTGAINSLLLYMVIYLIMSLGVFACILAVTIHPERPDTLTDLSGLAKTNPLIAFCMAILMLSMAGIPPLVGFWGKFYVFIAAVQQQYYILPIIGVLSSVVAAFYYLKVIKVMYFDDQLIQSSLKTSSQATLLAVISTITVIVLFIYPDLLINPLQQAAASLTLR